jgi:tetratricopeptide (TPR) repeat protein
LRLNRRVTHRKPIGIEMSAGVYECVHFTWPKNRLSGHWPAERFSPSGRPLALGREQDLVTLCRESEKTLPQQYRSWPIANLAYLAGDLKKSRRAYHQALRELPMLSRDPEACFCIACLLARVNDTERALEFLSLALESGYRCHHALLHDPGLESLRNHSRFAGLVSRAAEMSVQARTVFVENDGDQLLGVQVTTVI